MFYIKYRSLDVLHILFILRIFCTDYPSPDISYGLYMSVYFHTQILHLRIFLRIFGMSNETQMATSSCFVFVFFHFFVNCVIVFIFYSSCQCAMHQGIEQQTSVAPIHKNCCEYPFRGQVKYYKKFFIEPRFHRVYFKKEKIGRDANSNHTYFSNMKSISSIVPIFTRLFQYFQTCKNCLH